LVGIHGVIYWIVAHPTAQATAAQGTWPRVLWFSALLLTLGIAVLVFGWMVGGTAVKRWATVAFAAMSLAALVNIVEDGFRVEEAFILFALSTLTFDIALIALTIVISRRARDRYRLLAVMPAGTLAAILFFVTAGGPILLITWLIAAVAALRMASGPLITARQQA
jgi:hypothetical protein